MPNIKTREQAEQVSDMLDSVDATSNKGEQQESEQETNQHEEQQQEQEQEQQEQQTQETETGSQTSTEQKEESSNEETQDEVMNKLRTRIAELETGKAFEEPEQQQPTQQQEQQQQQERKNIESFMTDEEFEAVQTDPSKMNEVLERVYERASKDTEERVLRNIPDIIEKTSARQMTMREAVRSFYQENPDLKAHAQYVGFVANQVKSQNPDIGIQDVLKKTGEQVRENLALTKQAQDTEESRRSNDGKSGKPAFATGKGSGNHKGGKQDTRSDFAKQADAMIESLNKR